MDSLTQIVLGASVGEAVLGKKIGNKALLWGAVAGTIPDLDVLSGFFLDDFESLLFHRSLTHSLFFAVVISPLLAFFVHKLYPRENVSYRNWLVFFLWCISTHPLLDIFTNYGTELFYPFSNYRVAFNTIFVIDPLYTLPLLIGCIIILFSKNNPVKRKNANKIALILSSGYLLLTCCNKWYVREQVLEKMQRQQIAYEELMTAPAPLTNILWSIIIKKEKGYYVGYYSLFDTVDTIPLLALPQNKHLLDDFLPNEKVEQLIKFSKGFYVLEKTSEGLIFNDLRFSTFSGWFNIQDEFVFSFLLEKENGAVKITRKDSNRSFKMESFVKLGKRIMGENIKINGR